MNEEHRIQMLEEENQMLKRSLKEALETIQSYEEKYGNPEKNKLNSSFEQFLSSSKEKMRDKMKDEKAQEKIEKGKEMTQMAKKKVSEGSAIALDALKTAKNVFFNKDFQNTIKEEFKKQRNKPDNNNKPE